MQWLKKSYLSYNYFFSRGRILRNKISHGQKGGGRYIKSGIVLCNDGNFKVPAGGNNLFEPQLSLSQTNTEPEENDKLEINLDDDQRLVKPAFRMSVSVVWKKFSILLFRVCPFISFFQSFYFPFVISLSTTLVSLLPMK